MTQRLAHLIKQETLFCKKIQTLRDYMKIVYSYTQLYVHFQRDNDTQFREVLRPFSNLEAD